MAVMIAALTYTLTPESVLLSIGVLVMATTSLCGGALVTPLSMKLVLYLLVGLVVGLFLEIILLICLIATGYMTTWMYLLYGVLGMMISGILLFIDVIKIQILGKVAVDEYILGAVLLYVDIIRLLLYILMIFGKGK